MRTALSSVALVILTVGVTTAKPVRVIQERGVIRGSCEKLIVYDLDMTDHCDGKVANMYYNDGRNSFTFGSRDGAVLVTFSGNGKGQIHQGSDVAIQPLDTIFSYFGGKVVTIKVVGNCHFENPYKGRVPITCEAQSPSGEFSASFMSDGEPPDMQVVH